MLPMSEREIRACLDAAMGAPSWKGMENVVNHTREELDRRGLPAHPKDPPMYLVIAMSLVCVTLLDYMVRLFLMGM